MSAAGIIRLLIVDDHEMFREGVARMIEKEPGFLVTGQAANASDALKALRAGNPDVVLLDVELGSDRATDFVSAARAEGFSGHVLVVTAGVSDQEAIQLVESGVSGILHKHHSTSVLASTIRQVAAGEVSIEKAYLSALVRSMDRTRTSKRPPLTERDRFVMRSLLHGLTNRQIGDKLGISEGAIKASLRQLCAKLGVRTRTQLVKVALEQYKDQL